MKIKAKTGLIVSTVDKASLNMANIFLEKLNYHEEKNPPKPAIKAFFLEKLDAVLAYFLDDIIYLNYLDNVLDVEQYIFLSRHSSLAKIKSLTVHHTGNVTNEEIYGAKPRELCYTYPPLTRTILLNIGRYAKKYGISKEFEIVYEATHHGPTSLSKPLVFVEIGSSEEEWIREDAAKVNVEAIIDSLVNTEKCSSVLGFGGGHYSRKHTKHAFETNDCYSHIFSKHSSKYLTEELIDQAIRKTLTKVEKFVVEKKGVPGRVKNLISNYAEKHGYTIEYV